MALQPSKRRKLKPNKTEDTEQIPQTIKDFHVLALEFPTSHAYPKPCTHYLPIRPDAPPHSSSLTSEAEDASAEYTRTLFLANIPPTSTEAAFRRFFRGLSTSAVVATVHFSGAAKRRAQLVVTGEVVVQGTQVAVPIGSVRGRKRRREGMVSAGDEDEIVRRRLAEMEMPAVWGREVWEGGGTARVVFVDLEAMRAAWRAVRKTVREGLRVLWPEEEESGDSGGALGLERYKTHHELRFPPRSLLQERVNAYLTHYSALEALRAKQLARQRNVPDEEGFITVTRGGRTGAGRKEEAEAQQQRLKEREGKRIGDGFYGFQGREARKRREGDLKRRFEGERKRIEEMRGKKRVVPE